MLADSFLKQITPFRQNYRKGEMLYNKSIIRLMLDKRLTACAELVTGKRVCDIGTDHAYLVAELLSSGKCLSAVAADINEGPLSAAKATLEKYDVADKTDIILSDGLENIPPDGITDIVIAGMGAEMILHIINQCKWIKKDINLILQPMTHAPLLRKQLYADGFEITKEIAVCDEDKCYAVMQVHFSGNIRELSEVEQNAGFSDISIAESREYVKRQYERIYKIGKSLSEAGRADEAKPYLTLAEKILSYIER